MGSRYGGMKQLDPMTEAGEFIIDFSIYDAIEAGFDHVVFIIKEENLALFKETIGNRIEKKVRVSYAFQKLETLPAGYAVPEGRVKPWGTGHAVWCVKDLVKDNFAVINADDFYGKDAFVRLAEHLRTAGATNGVAHHCMIGYYLGNTLTENGTVSRGECVVDAEGMLKSVTERTKIISRETDAAYLDDDGETWVALSKDTIVSMNCWGFTPDIFADLERSFAAFLDRVDANPLKCEYYLPATVDGQRERGLCDVRVYPTTAKWHGVTYAEDKAAVKAAIGALVESGEYPARLWK